VAQPFMNQILLNQRVTSITYGTTDQQVVVTTNSGQQFVGDQVCDDFF